MKQLLTEEIAKNIPALYATEEEENPTVWIKFYHPLSSWYWYVTEYSPEERLFFGIVMGFFTELGYFSLDELSSDPLIERDDHFTPMSLLEVRKLHESEGRIG